MPRVADAAAPVDGDALGRPQSIVLQTPRPRRADALEVLLAAPVAAHGVHVGEAEAHASGEVRHHYTVSQICQPLEERGRLERVRAEGTAVPPDERPDRDGVRAHRVVVVVVTDLRSRPVY